MSKYPHTDQSVSDVHSRPSVYFLGTQSLCELKLESALNQEQPIPHDSANAEETIVDTSNVKYSFNSQQGSQLTLFMYVVNLFTDNVPNRLQEIQGRCLGRRAGDVYSHGTDQYLSRRGYLRGPHPVEIKVRSRDPDRSLPSKEEKQR